MSVNGLNTSLSALWANQFRQDMTANNIANVNTDGFQASTVTTADRAYINDIGTGTQVTGTQTAGTTYGPPPRTAPMAMDGAPPPPPVSAPTSAADARSSDNSTTGQSNTDLIAEMTNMLSAQRAYGSNTVMARTEDTATQTLLDLKR